MKLILGDAIDTLNNLPPESVDLIVTDPPYKCIRGGKPDRSKGAPSGMLSLNDGKVFSHNDCPAKQYMSLLYRVLKSGCHAYVMTNLLNLREMMDEATKAGFQIHNLLVWEKNNATPSRWYMKNAEFTLFLRKGKAKRINHLGSKMVHKFKNNLGGRIHPTEKPIELMKFYIENSSNFGDVVLDPFMGTGSTGLACLDTGREFIGIEVDSKYYEKAKDRLLKIRSGEPDYHIRRSLLTMIPSIQELCMLHDKIKNS